MPSPFPGMDPYLENPTLWPSFHHDFIAEIQGDLNRLLRPRYRASIEERVYLSDEDDPGQRYIVPDVHLVERQRSLSPAKSVSSGRIGLIEPIEISSLVADEVHDPKIEIRDSAGHTVVTVIEVLSITNKLKGSYGRKSYLQKRHEVLNSSAHLVEIDLLRGGVRMHIAEPMPPHDYLVHISRREADSARRGTVWPIPITLALPMIPIPLKAGDADVEIDLQNALRAAYDRDACDLAIDYNLAPVPPLNLDQQAWAKSLVTTWRNT